MEKDRKRRIGRVVSVLATILGIALVSNGFGFLSFDALLPFIFDKTGNFRTDGIFRTLSPLLLELNTFLGNQGLFLGLSLIVVGFAGTAFTAPAREPMSGRQPRRFLRAALAAALSSHGLVLMFSLPFFFVSEGHIRDMGWAVLVVFISVVNFLLTLPLAVAAFVKDDSPRLAAIAFILGLTPLGFAVFLLHFAAAVVGFDLAP